jgi:hypothetical protein
MRLSPVGPLLLAAALTLSPGSAKADDAPPPPSAERLRSAASEYDAGRRAFGEKDYEGAATHFENAYHDAPTASALRSAIRARKKAAQLARAATLATTAATLYAKDAATMAVVREVLKEAKQKLAKTTLHCTPACTVAADGRAISPEDAALTVFYLEPGDHEVVVSWTGDRNKTSIVTSAAGGDDSLTFEAPPLPLPKKTIVAATPPPPPPSKPIGLSPLVFYSGAGLTAILLGVTVWSGVDAENNPGAAAVKRDCVGQGTNCPEYQQGLSSQLRTNVLIGVTAAAAGGTAAIGIFFTQWNKSSPKSEDTRPPDSKPDDKQWEDNKTPAAVEGALVPMPGGAGFALRGTF